ncbi:hypothetical protein EY643_07750 [Halioglobus maricola]|uniref:Uncharacterized protein n=2 Tax=Halioglobus maricola TaxID=2601894 RepID=A0A5P9NPQ8_9GAMM|nr:hypothetical protein EY643_07750 [Halioglobus maricola]
MEPFLAADEAQAMLSIAESFGSFGTYADEATSDSLGENLPQRFDVGINYVDKGLTGEGNTDSLEVAASRTNYFRETYAYGLDTKAAGIEQFMAHPAFSTNAREISGCDNIVPAIVYANILIPGQELAIHTDVPEFRGLNRKTTPQWLLVVMLHSGLFNRYRIPILTCVSWFGGARGGAFTFYPDGVSGDRASIEAHHNSAIMVDTDNVFHGVERVNNVSPDLPIIGQKTRLYFCGENKWELRESDEVLAEFDWSQLRYSISWKGYCFANDEAQAIWRENAENLDVDTVLAALEAALRERGALNGSRPEPSEFAQLLVSTFVRFPNS